MNPDPLSIALREVADCKRLLETLIVSSESFDYRGAKMTLKQLNRKIRELSKLQTRFEQEVKATQPKIHFLDFAPDSARAQV